MPKEHINPAKLFPSLPLGFSQIVATHGGKTVYVSGQTGWDAQKRIVGGKDLGEQAKQALSNIRIAVEEAGGAMADIVSIRIYVVNYKPADAGPIGAALREFFPPDRPATSTLLGVSALAVEDFMIEIEAIAVID